MADVNLKVAENVPGKWYVDENCIACDSCISIAPDQFAMNEDSSHAYTQKQPETPEEEQLCEDAKASCPTDAIGSDGE
jgi:ferredoxin